MKKKIEELQNPPKDVNSPESQEFLRKLQSEIRETRKKFREEMEKHGVVFENEK